MIEALYWAWYWVEGAAEEDGWSDVDRNKDFEDEKV